MTSRLPLLLLVSLACACPPRSPLLRLEHAGLEGAELVVASGHVLSITEVRFSPDDALLATASNDETVKLWDLRIGRELRTLAGFGGPVYAVAFSPDGSLVAAGGFGRTVLVVDTTSGRVRAKLVHDHAVRGLAFSPDGSLLAVGLEQGPKSVVLWSPRSGSRQRRLPIAGFVRALAFAPDGRALAVADRHSGTVRVFDAESAAPLRELVLPAGAPFREPPTLGELAYSADGKHLVAVGAGVVDVYDPAGVRPSVRLPSTQRIHRALLSRTKGLLALHDGGVERWDLGEMKGGAFLTGQQPVALSHDGALWARLVGSRSIVLHDAASGREARRLDPPRDLASGITNMTRYFSVAASPVYPVIAAGGIDGRVRLWNLRAGGAPRVLRAPGIVHALAFDPGGHVLATASGRGVQLWNARSGARLHEIVLDAVIVDFAFSKNGGLLAALDSRGKLHVLVPAAARALQSAAVPPSPSFMSGGAVAWSSDGRQLLTGAGPLLWRWDTKAFRPLRSLPGHPAAVNALAFGPRGELAVGGGYTKWLGIGGASPPGSVILFDPRSRRAKVLGRHPAHVRAVAFQPQGKYLASGSGDGTLKLWSADGGDELASFDAHAGDVTSLAFTADGRFLASTGLDGAVRLWDVAGRQLAATLLATGEDDFVVALPEQYYTASRGGLRHVSFRVGQRALPLAQFDLRLNRPDLVWSRLGYALPPLVQGYEKAHQRRVRKMGLRPETLARGFELPELKLLGRPPSSTTERTLTVRVQARGARYALDRLLVFANDVALRQSDLKGRGQTAELDIPIPLAAGDNKIDLSVLNSAGVESVRETFRVAYAGPAPRPKLFVLAIGVSAYADRTLSLAFAAKDARDIGELLQGAVRSFEKVLVRTVEDAGASRQGILAAKEFLRQATVDDQVVVFVAGHGILHEGEYYFLPSDFDRGRPAETGVPYEALESLVDGLDARRKLMLIDTCHSGEADEDGAAAAPMPLGEGVKVARTFRGIRIVAKQQAAPARGTTASVLGELFADLRRGPGAVVIAAAAAAEYALEAETWRNGVFTSCVIDGVRSLKADTSRDGVVQVSELQRWVTGCVRRLTAGQQSPTSRRENLEYDFPVH